MNSTGSPAGLSTPSGDIDPVLSEREGEIGLEVICFLILIVNVVGVVTNIINIQVFLEQGVRGDSTNIGFLSLSVFDLLVCAAFVPFPLCFVVKYTSPDPTHFPACIAYVNYLIHPHSIVKSCSAWTTVYMSIVRSLCVVIPLKVKLLFTPRVTVVAISAIFVVFSVDSLLYAVHTYIAWYTSLDLNNTIAYFTETERGQVFLYYKSLITNQILSILAIVIVSMTTSVMVYKLIQVKKWRQKNMAGSGSESKSSDGRPLASKDIELVKSMTTVTLIFLICLLISYVPGAAMTTLPGVNFSGLNRSLFIVVYSIRNFFVAVNSSVNFFFYIRISSRYKAAFASSFPSCSSQDGLANKPYIR